jgi:hypothetical protein
MQTYEGIQHEQRRLQPGDGLIETCAVGLEIKTQAGRGDRLDVELDEAVAGGGTDAIDPTADDMECVFGAIEQNAAGMPGHEAAQAWGAGGDGNGQIEGDPSPLLDARLRLAGVRRLTRNTSAIEMGPSCKDEVQ